MTSRSNKKMKDFRKILDDIVLLFDESQDAKELTKEPVYQDAKEPVSLDAEEPELTDNQMKSLEKIILKIPELLLSWVNLNDRTEEEIERNDNPEFFTFQEKFIQLISSWKEKLLDEFKNIKSPDEKYYIIMK